MSRAGALLIDFGGVLTTNVFDGFAAFCRAEGIPENRFADLMRHDREAQRLLAGVETGELPEEEFERALAPLLGPQVAPERLLHRLTAAIEPDEPMVEAVAALRAAGVTTVLVSNSLGMHPYEGLDTDRLFEHVVISAEVGVRKPSRRIYEHALELAGVPAGDAVFVDDFEHNVTAAERLGLRAVLHEAAETTLPVLRDAFGVDLEVTA